MKTILILTSLILGLMTAKGAVFSRVIIDPGHGGRDKGAMWGGVRESSLNMKVSVKLEKILRKRGFATTMTRRSDTFVSLSKRAAIANRYRNAVFVSVHFNACLNTSAKGAETFYAGRKGRVLAGMIQRELVKRCKVRNRGVRKARFAVLMKTNCPAVLVECGFISNPRERMRCSTQWYQSAAAAAIAEGVVRYRRRG